MHTISFEQLAAEVQAIKPAHDVGRVVQIGQGTISIAGLGHRAAQGDMVEIDTPGHEVRRGEVLGLSADRIMVLPDGDIEGLQIGALVTLRGQSQISPDDTWIGRVVDPFGKPLDGKPLFRGTSPRPLRGTPPNPTERRLLGSRLETGMRVFNTLLPLVRGQRMGLFAGSGVGKSTLLAKLARGIHADVVVIALIGERGREVREFVDRVLGPEGMKRAIVVAATSDMSPLVRRRCGLTAMSVAEHFRDKGQQVLFLADSVTRFAEAHREIALAAGEAASLRGFPPSTAHQITALCERAGPGTGTSGDITAVFSVLVAGSDMEEPVADILRGVLDGHVVLDRQIAEQGRFPAIDLLRSVSRALPGCATEAENTLISAARKRLGIYDRSEAMIRAGLYSQGTDPELDQAITCFPALDAFLAQVERDDVASSFRALAGCLVTQGAAES